MSKLRLHLDADTSIKAFPFTQQMPNHHGILLAAQNSWTLSELIVTLNCLLTEVEAEEMIGQVRWLNEWKP